MINCPVFEDLFSIETNVEGLLSILSLIDSIPISQEGWDDISMGNLESIKSVYMQIL